jgi:tRNA 2-thiouridine synthesizing protein A
MSHAQHHAQHRIDATGLLCPEPLMIVRNKVREMGSGEVLHVLATDPSTARDFANFCRFMGHELVDQTAGGDVLEYWIRKGG